MIDWYDNKGIFKDGENTISFELLSTEDTLEIDNVRYPLPTANSIYPTPVLRVQDYYIAIHGKEHNNLPLEVRELVRQNPVLPEILKKQVRYFVGQGHYFYRKTIENDTVKVKPVESPLTRRINRWLSDWKANGLKDDFYTYISKCIHDFFYVEGVPSKYRLSRGHMIGRMPFAGLEHISTVKCRKASNDPTLTYGHNLDLDDADFKHIAVGNWINASDQEIEIFPRFSEVNPFAAPEMINYVHDYSFGEDIYPYPTFYYGLRDWIKGQNLNPKYINSYLKNALNARIHVLIPQSWILSTEKKLQELCKLNKELKSDGKEMIPTYEGVELGDTYSDSLLKRLIDAKLRKLSSVMSGEGKNQGKFFVSRKFSTANGVEEWEFKEIPTKYKEFIESIIDVDKRAMALILAGKGLDPSISNVSNEGIFQKSGSEAYYNYLIYIQAQGYNEYYITYDINNILRYNFPELKNEDIRLGFSRYAPPRMEETAPKDRMDKNKV